MTRSTAAVLVVVLLVAACSGGDDSEGSPSGTSAAATDGVPAPTDTDGGTAVTTASPSADQDGTANATTVPATTIPSTTAPATTTPTPLVEGIEATIELLSPVSGAGARPLLEWTPADGASMYTVAVYVPDDAPYWTWTGPETSVHVGGNPRLVDGVPGPSVSEGMSWAVIAFDDDMVPVAVSDRRPIAP